MAAVLAVLSGLGPLLLVAALAAPIVAAVVLRPQRGLLLLAVLVPFDGLLLVVDLPAPVAVWKEVLLGFTVAGAVRARLLPGRRSGPVPGWAIALGGMGAVALVGIVASDVTLVRAGVGLKVAFFGAVAGVVAWACPLDGRERDRLVTIFGTVGAFVALVGLWQQVVGPERLHDLGYDYNSVIRFSGSTMRSWSTFNQPFPFAYYLMVTVLLCGSVALARPDRRRNRLLLWLMPVYLAGLAVSVVKGAWLALAVGLVYLAVSTYRRLLHALPAFAGVIAVGLLLGLGSFFVSDSLFIRFDRWAEAPAAVVADPWGSGIGSAGAAAAKAEGLAGGQASSREGRAGTTLLVYQPDNHYVKVGYELGVVGLWLFLLALVSAHATARRASRQPADRGFGAGVAAVVVASAVASLGATFFEIFPLDYLVWLLVGVVSAPEPSRPRRESVAKGLRLRVRLKRPVRVHGWA